MNDAPEERPPAPRVLAWTAALVITAGLVMTFLGAWRTGVSFDEPFHVLRLGNFYAQGWYLLDDDLVGGVPGEWVPDTYVYAPVTMLLMHGVNRLLGLDPSGAASVSATAFAVRHLVVATLAAGGLAAVVATGRMLMRTWSWGLVAGAVLVAMPVWTGHAMFNVKDIPVAVGFAVFTCGLVLGAGRSPSRTQRSATVALVALGVVLAIGTRPGMWVGLGASLGVCVVLATRWQSRQGPPGRLVVDLALGSAVGLAVVTFSYRTIFAHPWDWLVGSAFGSSSYGGESGPRIYIPLQMAATLPTLLLVLGLAGWVLRSPVPRLPRWGTGSPQSVRLGVVMAQALVMPALSVVTAAHLYNGLRQLLFAAPAAALLLAWGLRRLLLAAPRESGAVRVLAVACAAAVAVPTLVQARSFPYNYTYQSVIFDLSQWPSRNDYWRTSFRELADEVPGDEYVVCSASTDHRGFTMRFLHTAGRSRAERSRNCWTDEISPIAPYASPDEVDELAPMAPTFVAVTEHEPGSNCTVLDRVVRPRHLTTQSMAVLSRCDLRLKVYEGPVEFALDHGTTEYLLGGWTGKPSDEGVQMMGRGAGLGFELPPELVDRDLRLDLTVSEEPADVLVNNEPVAWEGGPDRIRIEVPAAQASAFGEDRLVVTLEAADAGRLRLLAAELAASS